MDIRSFRARSGVWIGAAGLALAMAAGPARADHEFEWIDFDTDGETIGVVSGEVRVGYNNHAPFTVYTDPATQVDGVVYVINNATLAIEGGSVGFEVDAQDRSTVSISDGTIENGIVVRDRASAFVSGGELGRLTAIDRSLATLTGGEVEDVSIFDGSAGYIAGGAVIDDASVYFGSALVIAGGSIGGNVIARQDATVHLLGGSVGGDIISFGNGCVNVYGVNLRLDNPAPVIGGGFVYELTGALADGTPLNHAAYVLETGAIRLVDVGTEKIPPLPALLGSGRAAGALSGS